MEPGPVRLSVAQVALLVFYLTVCVTPFAFGQILTHAMGRWAWAGILPGLALALLALGALALLRARVPGESVLRYAPRLLGSVFGQLYLVLLALLYATGAGVNLHTFVVMVHSTLGADMSSWVAAGIMATMAAYLAYFGPEVIARVASVLLVGIVPGLATLLFLPWLNAVPSRLWPLGPIPWAALVARAQTASALGVCRGVILLLVLAPAAAGRSFLRRMVWAQLAAASVLVVAMALPVAVFGPHLAPHLRFPLLEAAGTLGWSWLPLRRFGHLTVLVWEGVVFIVAASYLWLGAVVGMLAPIALALLALRRGRSAPPRAAAHQGSPGPARRVAPQPETAPGRQAGGRREPLGRLSWLALAVAAGIGLSGCTQLVDIHNRSLVFGLAVDRGSTPGGVELAAQAIHPRVLGGGGSGGGGGGSGGGTTGSHQWKTLSAEGPTVGSALTALQAQTDRRVYLGQTAEVLLGEELAREGVLPELDALLRSPEVAETVDVVVVRGTASQLLRQGSGAEVGWHLLQFLTWPRTGIAVLANPLWRFLAQTLTLAQASYAPLFVSTKQGEGMRYQGTAVFLQGRMVGILSISRTAALSWLIRRSHLGALSGTGGSVLPPPAPLDRSQPQQPSGTPLPPPWHVLVRRVRVRWNLQRPDAPAVDVRAVAEATSAPGEVLRSSTPSLRRAVAQRMQAVIEQLLLQLQAERADLLGLGERLRARGALPPGPWPARFSQLPIAVRVQVRLLPGKLA